MKIKTYFRLRRSCYFYIITCMKWNTVLKVATGIVIVPISIIAHKLWPWWTQTPMPIRIISSVMVLPIVGIAAIVTPWWEGL